MNVFLSVTIGAIPSMPASERDFSTIGCGRGVILSIIDHGNEIFDSSLR